MLLSLPTELIKCIVLWLNEEDKLIARLVNHQLCSILKSLKNEFILGRKNILIEAFPLEYSTYREKYIVCIAADVFCRYNRLIGNNCLLVTALTSNSEQTNKFYDSLATLCIKPNIVGTAHYGDQKFIDFVQNTFIKLNNAGCIELHQTEYRLKKPKDIHPLSEQFPRKSDISEKWISSIFKDITALSVTCGHEPCISVPVPAQFANSNIVNFRYWFVNSLVNLYLVTSSNKDVKQWLTNSFHYSFSLTKEAVCLFFYYSAVILPGLGFKSLDNIHPLVIHDYYVIIRGGFKPVSCSSPEQVDSLRCYLLISPIRDRYQYHEITKKPKIFIHRAILLCINKTQRKIPHVNVEEVKKIYENELARLSKHIKQYHQFMGCQSLVNALHVAAYLFPKVGNKMFDTCLKHCTENLVFASLHVAKIIIIFIEPFMPQLAKHGKQFLNIKEEYYNMEKAELLNLPCGSSIPEDGLEKYFMYELSQ